MTQAEVDFTFEEAVRTLGVPPQRLERLIEEGKIEAINNGVQTLISRQAILDYMKTVSAVGKPRGKKS